MAQESCAIILPQFIAVCVIALRLVTASLHAVLFVLSGLTRDVCVQTSRNKRPVFRAWFRRMQGDHVHTGVAARAQ